MTEKEKQIEEMAKNSDGCEFLDRPCEKCWCREYNECSAYTYAKHFYEQGYRKINDNEIVMSKEEKQKLLKEMYEQGKFDAIADLEKEGKVVIGKEEFERLKSQRYIITPKQVKSGKVVNLPFIPIQEYEIKPIPSEEEIRKETAEKIFVKLINELITKKERVKKFYSNKESVGVDIAIRKAKDLAKQFGVDLGEDNET